MLLKQLEAFVNVAKLGSFSKAADAIYLTQPTISAHINALEKELGTKLIIRSTKEVYLSPAGKILYEYAVKIVRLCDQAMREVNTSLTEIAGTLEIAASTVPSQYILPKILPELKAKYPQVFYQVNEFDSSGVVEQVTRNCAEVGMVGALQNNLSCEFIPFASDRLVIITPNTAEYQKLQGEMTPEQIKSYPFVTRETGSGTRKSTEEFLQSIGIAYRDMNLAAQFQSTESVVQAVKNGIGISIVSRIAAEDYSRLGLLKLFEYDSAHLNREFYLVVRKGHPLSPAARTFIDELKNPDK